MWAGDGRSVVYSLKYRSVTSWCSNSYCAITIIFELIPLGKICTLLPHKDQMVQILLFYKGGFGIK